MDWTNNLGGASGAERRVDPTDGRHYTRAEFRQFYGSLNEWKDAGKARAYGARGGNGGAGAATGCAVPAAHVQSPANTRARAQPLAIPRSQPR